MNYIQTIEYLFSAMPSFQNVGGEGYKPGLERIESMCEALGSPHTQYPVVHVAGTNGKGSTSHMLASVLQSAGYRVGLFTSPHLRDFRERMRVNGEMICEEEVVAFVAKNKERMESLSLSFFEMTAAMAFDFFARSAVDVAVIETGLGGRLDATNIVTPHLSIITNIALEHCKYLGDTLPAIAGEKAGIIKRGRAVVVGERSAEYSYVFESRAAELGSEIIFATERYEILSQCAELDSQSMRVRGLDSGAECEYQLDLMGEYQRHNLLTLLTSVDVLRRYLDIPQCSLEQGLRQVSQSTSLGGRWERLSDAPLVVCDTGHNSHGLREVARQIARQSYDKLYCVLGFANDKDVATILSFFPQDAHFIFARPKVERAFDTSYLMEVASSMSLSCEAVEDVKDALTRARQMAEPADMIFVGGSNFVVAEL